MALIKKNKIIYLNCVRSITNCLINPKLRQNFDMEIKSQREVLKNILEFFVCFHDWENNLKTIGGENNISYLKINDSKTLRSFFKSLQEECTLALFLIFENEDISNFKQDSDDGIQRIKFLMQILKYTKPGCDIHLLTKALYIISEFHC
jgi:hypothetical protein